LPGTLRTPYDPRHAAYVAPGSRVLLRWRQGEAIVTGFQPRLFRLAGVGRDGLLADPEQLAVFFDRLLEERDRRTPSGRGGSLSDLVQSAARVKQRQDKLQRRSDEFDERMAPVWERMDRKLEELFPELQGLRG